MPTSLPVDLAGLVERVNNERVSFADLPIVTPDQRRAIPDAIAAVERSLIGASPDEILATLGTVSIVLPKKQTEENAEALATIYAKALDDIPADILETAGLEAIKTLKFFPKVAELRALAAPEFYRRRAILRRLQELAMKFDHEYRPPVDEPLVKAEDLTRLRKRLESRFKSQRQPA